MKVLHIITQLDLGGAQKNVLDIVRLLDKNRYKIYFVSSNRGFLAKDAIDVAGAKTVFLPTLKRRINPFADLATLIRLTLLFRKEAIDLVHTHSSKAGILGRWAARLAGVPIIVHTIHGWSFHNRLNFLARPFYIFLEKITAKFTDKLIAVSRSDIRKGLKNRVASENKYIFIPYGIDRHKFIACDININKKKKELGLDPNSPTVGMVASLKPQKSPQDFIYAASLVIKRRSEVQFLLVGDGTLRKKVERLIDRLELRKKVVLTGWRRDIPEILSCLDILVLSSLWEGSPRVFLEAMCSRVPIVAYKVDGVGEVIKNRISGFLVEPGDFAGLAKRICILLENKDLRKKMGWQGFNLTMNNGSNVEGMIKDLDNLYCKLVREIKPITKDIKIFER